MTCSYFSGIDPETCSQCLHYNKIKTPIVLGYTPPPVSKPETPPVDEVVNDEITDEKPNGFLGGPTP